jgi:hypothetical protein
MVTSPSRAMTSPKIMLIITSKGSAVGFVIAPGDGVVRDVGTGADVDDVNVHFECNSIVV